MAELPFNTDINSAIIQRCKKGERQAFHELYYLYSKAMFNIALRIVNNTEEAEEVLQDSFLKAFEKIGSFDPKYAFGAWLKKIVINGALDVLKKRRPVIISLNENLCAHEYNEEDDEPDFDIDTILKCVAELPDGYRTILSLFLFENCSHKEIAGLFGISEGTSKSQYCRAKKKLIALIKTNTVLNER